MLELLMNL